MPARVQQVSFALGKEKQADIKTASATHLRWRKIAADVITNKANTENDAAEYGKGSEWGQEVFATSKDCSGKISKFNSAEFCTWLLAFGLGDVSESSGSYTITPLDPTETIQLPYFSVVQQCLEGSGSAIDETYLGACINDFTLKFQSGPGRASSTLDASFIGSGRVTSPSGVDITSSQTEHYMLSSGMTVVANGTDYSAEAATGRTIISGTWTYNNNLIANAGYYPQGAEGLDADGFALKGRLEVGARNQMFQFTTRHTKDSDEYSKVKSLTAGSCVISFTWDSTHTVTITWPHVKYTSVDSTEADGILATTVSVLPLELSGDPVVTVSAKCGISGIVGA